MRTRGQHGWGVAPPSGPDAHDAVADARGDGRIALLTQAARAIDAELPRDELLQRIAVIAREAIGAHQAVISLTTVGAAQSISAVSLSDEHAGRRRFDDPSDGSGLAAPLLGRDGDAIGLLQLSDKYEGDFTAEDEELVAHLAQLAVLAISGSEARRDAEEAAVQLDALQRGSPVGFAVLDEELRYLRVNDALAEMNGIPAVEHVGRTVEEVVPDLAESVESSLRAALASGAPAPPMEVSGTTAASGGERRHWLVSYYPVEVAGERCLGCVAVDVTDNRLGTERLARSEQRYRTLVETTNDMIWTLGKDGRFDYVSGAVERMYGYSASELIGKPFLDFIPPERRQEDLEAFACAMRAEAAETLLEGETELLRKDGTVTIVEYRAIPLLGEDGQVVAVTGASTDVTERRRSEAAVRASEERFRSLFENAAVGMAVIDAEGGFVQTNPAFCRLLGRSKEELSKLTWDGVIHPEDRQLAGTRRARPPTGAADFSPSETRFVRPDGKTVWARLLGASVQGPAGEAPFALVQAVDLTEQRRLEETTSRLYALTRDLFITVDLDGRVRSVNPAWERVLGYTVEELLATPFLEFVAEEDRPRTRREFDRLRAGGELTPNFENRHMHKDGSVRWLLWSAYASPEEELIYGVAKDVSDRKRSEERLRESEQKYRDLVETSSDLIWSVDTGGRFTFVNRAARRIYGYEPEEMLGRPIADFETDEQRLRDEEALKGVLKGRALFSYETRHTRKDGRPVDLSVNAIVLHDDDGTVLGATGTATDVTDRKRFERRQAAVAELGRRALEGVSLAEITEAAVALVADTLRLDYCAVVELLAAEDRLVLHASVGCPPGSENRRIPADPRSSHAAYAIDLDGPVVVEDFDKESRFEPPEVLRKLRARSGLCVTIEGESRPFGALCAHSTRRRSFSADEVHFLQAVANVLATAIGRKRTEERIVELAAARGRLVAQTLAAEDRARRSISEVLHDHALQDLLASRQDLVEVIEDPEGDPERVVRAREGIERAVQLLRDAVFNLHPVVLEHAGLAPAIRAVADHQARRGNFECEIEVDPEATGVHDELILSLARELLTNVAKHAEAERVQVTVRRKGDWIELDVQDDGRGFDTGRREAALREGHVGLASSAERVEALAGRLEVDSRPGRGTRAHAMLPARRAAPNRADRPRRLPWISGVRRGFGR